MAVPTYEELLVERKVTNSAMEETFSNNDLQKFSLELDRWEKLARFVGISNPEIENIKSQGDMEEQRIRMLVCWKQRHRSKATYGAMAKALLQLKRTDLAEWVITSRRPSRDTVDTPADRGQTELSQATPPSAESISGTGDVPPRTPATLSTFNPCVHTEHQEEDNGILSILIEKEAIYSNAHPMAIQSNNENSSIMKTADGKTVLSSNIWNESTIAAGGRDVLIIFPDLRVSRNPEAVPRQSSNLTEEDKLKLQSQGVPPDCQNERDIMKIRYQLDKKYKVAGVKSGIMSQDEVMDCIIHLLAITKNDGVVVYYIGAGRRNTGDWCFEDGFITFRDITQLYLRASHNFKGRILTIISDCSYSGCWVRDCMEFLDEQGVQPCGHKAREKGIVIKVFASCKSNEIPIEYQYSVNSACNDVKTGSLSFWASKNLSQTQTAIEVDSSRIRCSSKTIDKSCRLQPDYTWKKWRASTRISLIHGKDTTHHFQAWHYVLVDDDEDTLCEFLAKVKRGDKINVKNYGKVLVSGWGDNPPNDIVDKLQQEYCPS